MCVALRQTTNFHFVVQLCVVTLSINDHDPCSACIKEIIRWWLLKLCGCSAVDKVFYPVGAKIYFAQISRESCKQRHDLFVNHQNALEKTSHTELPRVVSSRIV